MKPITEISRDECAHIQSIFFDIDDTFTLEGQILKESFSSLWDLHNAGFRVVPITGRPAGWCDHIARMWPVDGIVGENGAFYFYYDRKDKKLKHRYFFSPEEAKKRRADLDAIKKEVLKKIPAAAVASDQPYRLFDLAIDFSEDVPALTEQEIDEICAVFAKYGAHYKISSIHVNGWFGDYDKLSMTRLFIEEQMHMESSRIGQEFLFAGDSPNDEPMFRTFPISVGVANIELFAKRMKVFPRYITSGKGGLGFAEMAHIIIEKKGASNVE